MSQTKKFVLDLSGNYTSEVLSYYLWGQKTPPSKTDILSDKWIKRANEEAVVLHIDSKQFLDKTGLEKFHPYKFRLIERFFNTEHESGSMNIKEVIKQFPNQIKYLSNGEISLSYEAARNFIYLKDSTLFKDSALLLKDYYFYWDEIFNAENISKNAFVFGSVKMTLDKDNIRFVVDKDGNPLRIENFKIFPYSNIDTVEGDNEKKDFQDNFDFKGNGSLTDVVNTLLDRITDPFSIGKKVLFQYIGVDALEGKTIHPMEYDNTIIHPYIDPYVRPKFEAYVQLQINKMRMISRLLGFLKEFQSIQNSGVIDYLDDANQLVIYGTQSKDTLNDYKIKKILSVDIEKTDTQEQELDLSKNIDLNTISTQINTLISSLFPHSVNIAKELGLFNELMQQITELNHYQKYTKYGATYVAGEGNDTLIGTEYSDRFLGGNGDDIYRINGLDNVFDSDHKGSIVFSDDVRASRFIRNSESDDTWLSVGADGKPDGLMTAVRPALSHSLLVKHGKDMAVIRGFFEGEKSDVFGAYRRGRRGGQVQCVLCECARPLVQSDGRQ